MEEKKVSRFLRKKTLGIHVGFLNKKSRDGRLLLPRTALSCRGTLGTWGHRSRRATSRLASSVSSHPIKKPDIYIEEARRLRLRLNGLYNLYNTSG